MSMPSPPRPGESKEAYRARVRAADDAFEARNKAAFARQKALDSAGPKKTPGPRVSDTRGPNYPKTPARPGETKSEYMARVRGGVVAPPKGGSSSGGSRSDRGDKESAARDAAARAAAQKAKALAAATAAEKMKRGGSSSGGGSSSSGGRRDMGPVRGAPKGPAPMPPKPRPPAPSKFGTPRSTGGSRPKPLKGKM